MHEVFVWCLKLYHTCFFQCTFFSVMQSFFNLNANHFLNNIRCWLFSSNLMQLTAFPFSRNKINTSDIFNDGLLKNLNINLSFFHNYHGDSPLVSIIILFQCGVVTYLCNSVVTFPLGQKKMSSMMARARTWISIIFHNCHGQHHSAWWCGVLGHFFMQLSNNFSFWAKEDVFRDG